MMSYRFSNPTQKEVHLATLRHLMLENQADQIAKTVLSNAVAVSETVMVPGELDELMRKTDSWYRRGTRWLSVFFIALSLFEFGFAWGEWEHGGLIRALGPLFFGLALLAYCAALQAMWRIQRRYHDSLHYLEGLQLELPPTPVSLRKVN